MEIIKRMLGLSKEERKLPEFDLTTARTRCRIALIDDESNALPLQDLLASGYEIEQFFQVTADLLQRCERGAFHIIVLDYNGIAPQNISPTDGFGVFEIIRNSNPQQYIIAISAKTYDIQKSEYFQKADSRLSKPIDLIKAREALDRGIRAIFDPNHVIRRLSATLQELGYNEELVLKISNLVRDDKSSNLDQLVLNIKSILSVTTLPLQIVSIVKLLLEIR